MTSKKYKFVALCVDPSYTNTGVTIYADGQIFFEEFKGKEFKIGKRGQQLKTLGKSDIKVWTRNLRKLLNKYSADEVGLYYARMGSMKDSIIAVSLGKLIGILEISTHYNQSEYEQTMRKQVLGIGQNKYTYHNNVKKKVVDIKEVSKEYFKEQNGIDVSDDIADSYVVFKYFENDIREHEKSR